MPNNWKTYKLNELCVNITDGAHSSPKEYVNGEKLIATVKDMTDFGFKLEQCKRISDEDFQKLDSSGCIPNNGDVLFSKDGTIGKVLHYKSDYRIGLLSSIAIFRPNNELIDSSFLTHYLSDKSINNYIRENFRSGSAIPRIILRDFKKFDLTIPPLPEQKAIANILSAIDDKIENNLDINKTLEDMAMALYKHWFVDFGPFQDGEFIDSELGPIPKGWEVKKFNDFIEKIIDNRGKTPPLAKENTNYLLLETYQLTRDTLFPKDVVSKKAKYVTEDIYNSKKWFRKGHPQFMDILFATVGNGIPNWSLMYENNGVGIAQNVVAIRPKDNISSSFLRYSFESKSFLQQFDGYVITTAQPSIKLSDLSMIDILMPEEKTLNEWNDIVDVYVKKAYSNYKENKNLKLLRDTLLPKLISGEVRLKKFKEQVEQII